MKSLSILKGKLASRKGQGAVEYALVTLAIVLVIIAVLFPSSTNPLNEAITGAYDKAAAAIDAAPTE